MSSAISYRLFLLQAMRIGPLEIAGKITEHQGLMDNAYQAINRHIRLLFLLWSMGVSIAMALAIGLYTQSMIVAMAAFGAMVLIAFMLCRLKTLQEKLHHSPRYALELNHIRTSQAAVNDLKQQAKAYQIRLEIKEGPGFIAVYGNTLLSDYYPSFFSRADRERYINLSRDGRGGEIDLMDYSRLVRELKTNGIEGYHPHAIVDKVTAQNKQGAALAYARLIALSIEPLSDEDINYAAMVGLNAWFMFNAQGLPASWEHQQHCEWSIAKTLLVSVFTKNSKNFELAVNEFKHYGERRLQARG